MLVIFDCDGVLIDSELIACAADADALAKFGFPITTQQVIDRFAGMPSNAMYAQIEAEMGCPLPTDFDSRVKAEILKKYRTDLRPIPGIADVLQMIRGPKCVASSSSPAKLALGLVETDLFELFYPHIFSASLVPRGKPNPDLFLYAADRMGVVPAECIVVEDSVAGVTAAHAAGMRCVGFTGASHCGSGHGERLIQAGASIVIDKMSDLPPLISPA